MAVSICVISGTLVDLTGTVLAKKEISFVIEEFKATNTSGEIYVGDWDDKLGAVKRVRSAIDGTFSVTLPREAVISIELREAGILGKFTVPDSATEKLSDILNSSAFTNRYNDLNA